MLLGAYASGEKSRFQKSTLGRCGAVGCLSRAATWGFVNLFTGPTLTRKYVSAESAGFAIPPFLRVSVNSSRETKVIFCQVPFGLRGDGDVTPQHEQMRPAGCVPS